MRLHRLRHALLATALAVLAACGGGGDSAATVNSGNPGSVSPASAPGTTLITMTDAPGDFVSYVVKVVSIQLRRADGTAVETLPASTDVDFAQLVDLAELISAAQVPAGSYTGASVTLDYAGATIIVETAGGNVTVPPANILNATTGSPLLAPNSQVTLALQLPSSRPLVVNAGTVANLALDFSLAVSNNVGGLTSPTPATAVTVSVTPVLAADIVPDAERPVRLRGTLSSVTNTATATSYAVNARPFFRSAGSHGAVTVTTTAATTYLINGTSYTGSAGLAALAALPAGTLTSAQGSVERATRVFTATQVLAGSSVPGAGIDGAEGTVVARSGNVLTLSGGFVHNHTEDRPSFGRTVVVTVGPNTRVSKLGSATPLAIRDISVGQRVAFSGQLTPAAADRVALDATSGSARLLFTSLWGLYGSQAAGVATINLQAIEGRPPSAFNFAGTGATAAQDVVASAYTVAVPPSLPLAGFAAGSQVRFLGFANPFGAAPPAFTATSVINFAQTAARVELAWQRPGATAPFSAPLSASNVVIGAGSLQASEAARVRIGLIATSLKSGSTGLTLVPDAAAGSTGFAIAHAATSRVDSYANFGDAIAALAAGLGGTTGILALHAEGAWTASSGTLATRRLFVVLND